MRSDTEIHQSELLLVLDYLLHYTDEEHPATQIKICKHANKYGLHYYGEGEKGNEIDRTRISQCLKFLKHVSDHFPDDVPFVLQKTDSGKYYIEQRNGLDEDQIAKILATLHDDKYAKESDTEFLVGRLLDAFATSEKKKEEIALKAKQLSRGVKKADKETIRRLERIETAYREGKTVRIFCPPSSSEDRGIIKKAYYRVCMIKDINGKPHAFLLPISPNSSNQKGKNFIFDAVENIRVVNSGRVLADDDPRDFNELFKQTNPDLAEEYGSLDEMLKKVITLEGYRPIAATLCIRSSKIQYVKKSFETFFSEDLHYREIPFVSLEKDMNLSYSARKWVYFWERVGNRDKKCCIAKLLINHGALVNWLLSGGRYPIRKLVRVLGPDEVNETLARYYCSGLEEYFEYLPRNRKSLLKRVLLNPGELPRDYIWGIPDRGKKG